MTDYAIPADHQSLFPDEPNQYAVVLMDTMKPPDSEGFINKIAEYETAEFSLPPQRTEYTYYVYTTDGETYTRDVWQQEKNPAKSQE